MLHNILKSTEQWSLVLNGILTQASCMAKTSLQKTKSMIEPVKPILSIFILSHCHILVDGEYSRIFKFCIKPLSQANWISNVNFLITGVQTSLMCSPAIQLRLTFPTWCHEIKRQRGRLDLVHRWHFHRLKSFNSCRPHR